MEENKSIETTPEPEEEKISKDKLIGLLTQKQKKALGLLPEKFQSEKAKARNEMLRERMKKINEERKSQAKQAVKGVIVKESKKRKQPEPKSEEEEDSETSSEDQVIQKRAKKVSNTIKHLSKVEERLLAMQSQANPFMRLMFGK